VIFIKLEDEHIEFDLEHRSKFSSRIFIDSHSPPSVHLLQSFN
jgi:hypothetical protein